MPTPTSEEDGRHVRDLANLTDPPIDPGLGLVYIHLGALARELRRTQGVVGQLRDRLGQ